MTAEDIRKSGKKIKSWEKPDGSWYKDCYEIWQLDEHYYQIHDHVGLYFSCTMSKFGEVTEIEKPELEEIPTHLGIAIGVRDGKAWIEGSYQGTPDKIATWYDLIVRMLEDNPYRRNTKTYLKIVELSFD